MVEKLAPTPGLRLREAQQVRELMQIGELAELAAQQLAQMA